MKKKLGVLLEKLGVNYSLRQGGAFFFTSSFIFSKEGVYSKRVPKKANQLKTISELTPKQRKFVDVYVSNYGEISKVEAAKQAGFTSTNKYGPTDQAS